jgi:hypothetical protein
VCIPEEKKKNYLPTPQGTFPPCIYRPYPSLLYNFFLFSHFYLMYIYGHGFLILFNHRKAYANRRASFLSPSSVCVSFLRSQVLCSKNETCGIFLLLLLFPQGRIKSFFFFDVYNHLRSNRLFSFSPRVDRLWYPYEKEKVCPNRAPPAFLHLLLSLRILFGLF